MNVSSFWPAIIGCHSQPLPLAKLRFGYLFPETPTTARSPQIGKLRRFSLLHGSSDRRDIKALSLGIGGETSSPWDDKPYELLPGGRKAYLDEQDVVSFLDPPKELIPIEPDCYNPASYLWKKIGDIPEERRRRLLSMITPRLIPRLWEVVGARYNDAKLAKQSASALLSMEYGPVTLESWSCRASKGPLPLAWLNDFKKLLFHGKDGGTYGRICPGHVLIRLNLEDLCFFLFRAPFCQNTRTSFPHAYTSCMRMYVIQNHWDGHDVIIFPGDAFGGPIGAGLEKVYSPLYFTVGHAVEVMSTEQPCDIAYDFRDGLLDLGDIPDGFPKPAKHPWPFDDHLVIYIRHVGPGVVVGQAWQEGKDLDKVPRKFCGEILMVKD